MPYRHFKPGRELTDREKVLLSIYRDLNDFGQMAVFCEVSRLSEHPFYLAKAMKIELPKNSDKPNKK